MVKILIGRRGQAMEYMRGLNPEVASKKASIESRPSGAPGRGCIRDGSDLKIVYDTAGGGTYIWNLAGLPPNLEGRMHGRMDAVNACSISGQGLECRAVRTRSNG